MANQTELIAAVIEKFSGFLFSGRPPQLWQGIPPTKYPALTSPAAPSVANVGATGAATYTYAVVARQAATVTLASSTTSTATGNGTLSGTNYNTVTWAAVAGATSYDVYRTAGGTNQGLIASGIFALTTSDQSPTVVTVQAVPTANTTGGAVDLPIAAIFDDGPGDLPSTFEHMYEEMPTVRIEVFASSKTAAKAIVQGIMFNGGTPAGGLGLHYAASLPLTAAWQFMQMHAVGKPIYAELTDRNNAAGRVYQATLRFLVQAVQIAAV